MLKDVEWEAWGTPKLPQRLLNVRKSEDGLTALGECGGSCGGCQPIKEKMYVEPAACTDASSTGMYKWPGRKRELPLLHQISVNLLDIVSKS